MLEEGARVVLNGRTRESVEKALSELRGKYEGRVYGVAADLTRREDVHRLVEESARYLDGLDSVVYITGPPRPGRFLEIREDEWEENTRLLILNAIWLVNASIPYLRRSRNPSIVFSTSIAVKEPLGNLALSNVLRLGIHGLVRTLARELGREGIRVNAVMPGYIETDRVRRLIEEKAGREGKPYSEAYRDYVSEIPLGRLGSPKEYGRVVAFLVSEYASYLNGASIPVDGGLLRSVF
ncbi:short-chain dehydrogenase/reductase SDR [Desulfurococcus mucosus DSM 2162]|uniref:Short-chain dehydrogenase/reductase SDR n=1 Tax=Desulfurococcus mucosus (strain ATCC 35584 / DSM 2162 / JCM 9187 / O7/1) TaxID=765177 RepID=E8RAD4_DESM0|nr:short-chain dehydrogenase/reductase SDR [Desulfurococcus mucosus DSM 2162]